MTLDEAIAQFADYARGEGGFDELDLKEVIEDNRDEAVQESNAIGHWHVHGDQAFHSYCRCGYSSSQEYSLDGHIKWKIAELRASK